jgi:hypothetical protein
MSKERLLGIEEEKLLRIEEESFGIVVVELQK